MDNINDIIASLSPEDIQALKDTAASIFSSDNKSDEKKHNCQSEASASNFDFSSLFGSDMFSKIPAIMSVLNSDTGKRCRLIEALKPNLSISRQKKADEAMQIIKIMELLPLIANLNNRGD